MLKKSLDGRRGILKMRYVYVIKYGEEIEKDSGYVTGTVQSI